MLSENLYTLRRRSGLSQEQLAQQLGVSRQAISKWEAGTSMPEGEKLIAISQYFNVSLDCLLQGRVDAPPTLKAQEMPRNGGEKAGLVLCAAGIVGLLLWGLIAVFSPAVAEQISASSVIRIDGSGICLAASVAAIAAGAWILLKRSKEKEKKP